MESCCTCAKLLADTKVPYDTESEKPLCFDRRLECCGRTICAACQYSNPRFQTYCPFCQISSAPSSIPATGLRLPPSYSENDSRRQESVLQDRPPAYETVSGQQIMRRGPSPPTDTQDVVHFLSPDDTIQSISLAYAVPAPILRQHNNLYQDSLLPGRKFVLVPSSHYQGPALSTPPDPAEEERKNKIRRWMVATKCAEYNVALLYLKACDYALEPAIESFKADERWEKENPLDKGKGKTKDGGAKAQRRRYAGAEGGLTGQLT